MTNQSPPMPAPARTPEQLREETERKIRRLESRAGRGLWALALFIALSLAAWRGFDLLPPLTERWRDVLGPPPSPGLISVALVVYSFSAIVLTLGRMAAGTKATAGFQQVAYLAGFYAFYHLAGATRENFLAVLVAGLTILGLESYHLWNTCVEAIRQEKEVIATLDRRTKFSPSADSAEVRPKDGE